MKTFELKAERRKVGKKSINRKLRREGKVPAEIYGKDMENLHIAVNSRELYRIVHSESGINSFIRLIMEGKDLGLFVIKELDIDPIKLIYRHVDFAKLTEDEEMTFHVPVHFEGVPEGVKKGGILEEHLREVEITCLPKDLVDYIAIDISHLEIGEHISISDLQEKFPNFKFEEEPETVVVIVSAPKTGEEESEEGEGEEPEVEVIHGKKEE